MNSRRYIGALIIVLTFLGVVYQQQNSLPNQEIVLQFSDVTIASDEAQSTITFVKAQLQNIGVDNIQIKEDENGVLKITYYSDTDVESIEESLNKKTKLKLSYNSDGQQKEHKPISDNEIAYNLDVYEIQKSNDSDWKLLATNALEFNSESDRFFNPNVFLSAIQINNGENETSYRIVLKTQKNIAIAIDNTSYNIPEVRAGP